MLSAATVYALKRQGIISVGLLQILTDWQLRGLRGVGQKSRDVILAYLESKKLRLSRSDETPRGRAVAVFGKISRLPIEYLTVRTGIYCGQLRDRGVYCVHQLKDIPKARVAAIPQGNLIARYHLTPQNVDVIEQELKALGLRFSP